MQIKAPPFTNVRVRQAVRLLVNRPLRVKLALNGYGKVGNDVPLPLTRPTTAYCPNANTTSSKRNRC
jgi:ABC-type transport system substrate-binding protein